MSEHITMVSSWKQLSKQYVSKESPWGCQSNVFVMQLPWCHHGHKCHVITMETTTIFTKWLPWRYSTCCLYQNRVWKHSRHEMYRVPDSFGKQREETGGIDNLTWKKLIRLKRGKKAMYNNLEMGKKREKLTIWHGKKMIR